MQKHLKKHLPKVIGATSIAFIGFAAFSFGAFNKGPHIDSIYPTSGPDRTLITLTGSNFAKDSQGYLADFIRIEGKNSGTDAYLENDKTIKFTLDLSNSQAVKECTRRANKQKNCHIAIKLFDAFTNKESNAMPFLVTPPSAPTTPPVTTPIASCSLNISVSSSTPVAQNVSRGQAGVSLVKFNITPRCDQGLTGITLKSFAVSLLPMPSGYTNVSSLRLFNDADGALLGTLSNITTAGLNFVGLSLSMPANQTATFTAVADISSSATLLSTVYGVFGGSGAIDNLGGGVGNNAGGNIFAGNTMTVIN